MTRGGGQVRSEMVRAPQRGGFDGGELEVGVPGSGAEVTLLADVRRRSRAKAMAGGDLACPAPNEVRAASRRSAKPRPCLRPSPALLCSEARTPWRGAKGAPCRRRARWRRSPRPPRHPRASRSAPPCDRGGPRRRRGLVPGRRRSWRSGELHCDPAPRARRRADPDEAPAGTTCRQRRATIGCPGGPRSSHSSLSRYVVIRP